MKTRRRPLLLNFYMIHTNAKKINPYFLEYMINFKITAGEGLPV